MFKRSCRVVFSSLCPLNIKKPQTSINLARCIENNNLIVIFISIFWTAQIEGDSVEVTADYKMKDPSVYSRFCLSFCLSVCLSHSRDTR